MEAPQAKMEETELMTSQVATATVSKPVTNDLKEVLRREFKMNGQIQEPGARAPRFPIDQIFGLYQQPKSASYLKYVKVWAKAMKDAYEIVKK